MSSLLLHHNIAPSALTRPVSAQDATMVHHLYQQTPQYLDIVAMRLPSVAEIAQDLHTAEQDTLRHTELVLCPQNEAAPWDFIDSYSQRVIVGYLDYKIDYPQEKEVVINLLLIPEALQGKRWGSRTMQDFETRLEGHYHHILASVYGRNEAAARFWKRLGYHHALDAQPIVDWYGKDVAISEQV